MAKRTARKGKSARVTAANGRTAVPLSQDARLGRRDLFILLGLAVMTFGIYAQVVGHQFISLDDDRYIVGNPMVNRGITSAGFAWAFTTFYEANWHPLTWIAHMIDSQLFGMNAGGHLLVNAVIHVANTVLVFFFLLRTTHARWPSAVVAALFALHPLHVESVAWASERKDTLSTFFGLLSLIAYSRYAEMQSPKWYAWTTVTLVLGLLAKPMLVTWPFVMLLLDYWPLRRLSAVIPSEVEESRGKTSKLTTRRRASSLGMTVKKLIIEKIPFFAIVAASAVITVIAQSPGGAGHAGLPLTLRLSNALVSYAKYLLLTFWPHDLAVYYPITPTGIPPWQIMLAALVLIGITTLCLFQWKIRPYLIVGWLWFLGTLVPVIGLIQVGRQAMADRYFYIPSIGLFIALVFGLSDVVKRQRVAPPLGVAIPAAVLLILATLTNAQIHYWRDSFALFNHSLAVTPSNVPIENSLGYALRKSGRLDEAAAHLEKALQIKPDDYESLLNMGLTRFTEGRVQEAVEYYQAATRSRPDVPTAHKLLGIALATQNHDEAALDELRHTSELAPEDPATRYYLGIALERLGRIPEAIEQFQQALRLNPNSPEAHTTLGMALLASGKVRESIPEFETALRLKPELKEASDGLGRARAQLGQ